MRAGIAAALGLAVAACAAVPRTLEVELPGSDLADPVRVVVIDRVGIVRDLAEVGIGPADGRPAAAFVLDGDRDTLHVAWVGGMCDRVTTLTVASRRGKLVITEGTERDPGGCRLAGIGRQVALELDRPVDPSTIEFVPSMPGGG